MAPSLPSLGRMVTFISEDGTALAALVTGVADSAGRLLNLTVFRNGATSPERAIIHRLRVPEGERPGCWHYNDVVP